jgi:hypothetical protein
MDAKHTCKETPVRGDVIRVEQSTISMISNISNISNISKISNLSNVITVEQQNSITCALPVQKSIEELNTF